MGGFWAYMTTTAFRNLLLPPAACTIWTNAGCGTMRTGMSSHHTTVCVSNLAPAHNQGLVSASAPWTQQILDLFCDCVLHPWFLELPAPPDTSGVG